jgi:hypothetical protein
LRGRCLISLHYHRAYLELERVRVFDVNDLRYPGVIIAKPRSNDPKPAAVAPGPRFRGSDAKDLRRLASFEVTTQIRAEHVLLLGMTMCLSKILTLSSSLIMARR